MLQTARLTLREIVSSDLMQIHDLLTLPETNFYNALGIPESTQVTKEYLDNWIAHQQNMPRTLFAFVIEEKKTTQFLGLIALTLGKLKYKNGDIWFKIHKNHWGQGYATEACRSIISYGFEFIHLHRIEAGCAVENRASKRVLEKAGMTLEGVNRKLLPHRGGWLDCYAFAILEAD